LGGLIPLNDIVGEEEVSLEEGRRGETYGVNHPSREDVKGEGSELFFW